MPEADLTPFVPRLIPEWIADAPDRAHRAIDGTLVFTDLSGFTAMSERLGAFGKVGAEELTDHLDAIFTELITVAAAMGGSMLKFGGDALLILFWGPDHEMRAAAAALNMQSTLDRIGLVQTSAGEARLRMTVGAHSGTFDFFLAGTSHRAMFVCGADAGTACAVEASAEAGEVRVSRDLASRLGPAFVSETCGEYPLLVSAPAVASDIPPVRPWPEGTSARKFVPAMLRTHLLSGVQSTEHRQMAVGFIHLSNVDELLADIGPEATTRHLDDLVSTIQHAFAAHDVAFISTDIYDGGPKIVCTTGAVRTFENDEERLLRALRDIADYPSPIDLRIGAHRGHGFCGYVGPEYRRTFAIIGDVVNTAARVMSNAEPGQILATADVIDRSETVFETTELPPFAAKGKSEPLVAHVVGAITGSRRQANRAVPFVGRAEELRFLSAALDGAKGGRGSLIELVGEPGIGKTRIVEDWLAETEGVHVVQVRCGRYASDTPYFPFRTLLRDTLGELEPRDIAQRFTTGDEDVLRYLPLANLPLGLPVTTNDAIEQLADAERREKCHEVVAALLRELVVSTTAWFVDDAQWADTASIELLKHLSSTLRDVPLVLCAARRPEGPTADGIVLEVNELDPIESGSLVSLASDVHLLEQEIDQLTERARGNPLFLIELAEVHHGRNFEDLPDSLEAVLSARIDGLQPAERHVLRQLAVLGTRFSADLAVAVVDDLPVRSDPVWERLGAFLDVSESEWRFAQSLVRETAYEGLSYKERRAVHHRTGVALEGQLPDPFGFSELLSLHFHFAGSHEKAFTYSKDAAEKAVGAFAYAEAATFFSRTADAARALDDSTALADALTALGHREVDLARYELAQQHYEESLEIKRGLGNMQGVAAQLNGLGLVARQRGEYERAEELFREAVDILRSLPNPETLGNALNNLGTVAWYQGRYDDAKGLFTESLDEQRRTGTERDVASALQTLGAVSLALGEIDTAEKYYEEAGRISKRINDKPHISAALNNLGTVAFRRGDYDAARELYEECLAVRRELRDRAGMSTTLTNLGTIAYFQDDRDLARDRWKESLRLAREIGNTQSVAQNLHNLSEVERDPLDAMVFCQEALTIRRNLKDLRGIAESLTTQGKLATQRGKHAIARSRFIEAIGLLQQLENKPGLAECLELVAATCAAGGDAVRAATLLGVVDAMCDEMDGARSWASDVRATLEATLRAELGAEVYEATTGVGRSMTFERAVALAQDALTDETSLL